MKYITFALMATKDITPRQYAKVMGCTLQNVTKKIRNGSVLSDVIKIKNFSRFYLLEVEETFTNQSFKVGKIKTATKRQK